jgi:hypothetical protein
VNCSVQPGAAWATLTAPITARTAQGRARPLLESDDATRWLVDGDPAAHLDGCLEADLELSALTNAVPVHRLGLPVGSRAAMPTAAGWFGHGSPGWGAAPLAIRQHHGLKAFQVAEMS